MLESMRTKRGRIVVASIVSVAIAALVIAFELPIALMPAMISGLWIPVLATQFAEESEPVSLRFKLWMMGAMGVGVVALGLGVVVYAFSNG